MRRKLLIFMLFSGLLFLASTAGVSFWLEKKFQADIYFDSRQIPPAQTAIVLGTSVYASGAPSSVLLERLDRAMELYRSHQVQKLLFSGDHLGPYYDEVNAMKDYALRLGARPEDIFLDHTGLRTLDSMYRARHIFKIKEAIIVTQRFHLPRSLFLARAFGFQAVGLAADSGRAEITPFILAREHLARSIALAEVCLWGSQARFMGRETPITGNGRSTWDKAEP